ncbi:MAG TPA: aminomethyl-transferring glycine dehydrogenase subunit GcvPB [Phycisphaerae bacterium]|nr:aminomethyl-transferring glycine dehydrogenase subunit GcvPB [Phycisphaerae bacterium]HRY67327.1 aminomethyl-transferring glycine dehydrogenase subunit GcvPB [Phycisphaerae bacterium]HSA28470.1 aminomethyl-transferring glycine dehydrogenase subunit GcvPB [Phycisphaerae bacterium]
MVHQANPSNTLSANHLSGAGLVPSEKLIFERSTPGLTAVSLPPTDVPPVDREKAIPRELLAESAPLLPEVGELDLVRHYTRLAHRLFSVDGNFYPLGSCTMKYNPKINERAATMPGFTALHPLQAEMDIQGMMELLFHTRTFLAEIAGLADVTLQPCAGAHGEMTGVMIISAYHRHHGQDRPKVLTPDSAHGTNPATCTMCGRHALTVSSRPDGRVDLNDLRSKVDEQTAALMITNPNTTGLFDPQIADIAEILHAKGALLYLDGANMNAILGIARPGDFGVDVMHFNVHKTFSTPHGCGGPGAGPVAVSEKLRGFLPGPQVIRRPNGTYGWDSLGPNSIGRVRSFHGQIGVLVRTFAYIRALGAAGLRGVSEKAVLSANYIAARMRGHYAMPFEPPYAHEFITVPEFRDRGVTELDIAKRLIDHSFHPPTMSWPVAHCLMIEPTETESLATLDQFIEAMISIAREARENPDVLHHAPHTMPVRRLDEVTAARKPDLCWQPESPSTPAAPSPVAERAPVS